MDIAKLKTLYQILEKSSVEELIVKSSDIRLKICKGDDKDRQSDAEKSKEEVICGADGETSPQSEELLEAEDKNVFDVLSSQVGFFSRFNSRTGKQYVKLRDIVRKGDVIGVVMAMHIEHKIVAESDGKITDFLVEEKQPVEYSQPLVRLLKKYDQSEEKVKQEDKS